MVYAKSNRESLAEHTENTLCAFASVKSLFPYIPSLCDTPDFWRYLFLCLFFHDFGKSATGFQDSLECREWNYRHEILSAGFILNVHVPHPHNIAMALAVLTHHHGSRFLGENYRTYGAIGQETGKRRWQEKVSEMAPNQSYLYSLLEKLPKWSSKYLGESLFLPESSVSTNNCQDALALCIRPLLNRELTFSNRFYPIFLRGLTIACDHLASAGKKAVLEGLQNIYSKLAKAGEIKELKHFQSTAMGLQSSAYLSAPTGTGKTSAALLWCQKNQDSGRRIFYVLPYTASINAMQQRLKNIFGKEEVGILHHRANYFIYKSFLEQNYNPTESATLMRETASITRKIYRPIKVLTPYQIIKAFYGVKGFECVMSEMAGGLFVFDEIHCYEPRTVALIVKAVEQLSNLGAKFMFMSATLPKFLAETLSKAVDSVYPIKLSLDNEEEKGILMQARHRIVLINKEIMEFTDEIIRHIKDGKKVLVVCNAVARAQEVYTALAPHAKRPCLIHGRFITADRERIESNLANADLLVGTQAIEVSLNVDFDVIFTEPAPIDALLQRFGRVNRFGKSKDLVPAYVFKRGSKADEYIYDQERVIKTLSILPDGEPLTNQKALELVETLYEEGYTKREQKEYEQAYRDFGFVIQQMPLFDESEFTEEFFELIKAVEIVPIRFHNEYLALKNDNRYLDAIGYVLTVSLQQYQYLKAEGRITQNKHDIFLDAKYSNNLGLILGQREQLFNIVA